MKFMIMHKHSAAVEAGEKPSPEMIAKMGAFIGEHMQAGRFLNGDGLGKSAGRTRVTCRGGQCTVQHGPYAGVHELPAATLTLKVATREQAIGWAERYARILGDAELEIGPVTEPWDLGMMPKPDDAPLRVLVLVKADAASERGEGPTPKQKAELSRLETEMTKAGVLLASERLAPSARAKRLMFTNNALRVIDGPFSESKELIGGYALMQFDTIDEAVAMCRVYVAILGGTLEIDVRPVLTNG